MALSGHAFGRSEANVDTIVSMRRVILIAVTALLVGGVAWALWPATSWPRALCAPVVRVFDADARALAVYQVQNKSGVVTPTEYKLISTLRADVVLAEAAAPSSQLRSELHTYAEHLHGAHLSINEWTTAMSNFDVQVRNQLGACGVTPAAS